MRFLIRRPIKDMDTIRGQKFHAESTRWHWWRPPAQGKLYPQLSQPELVRVRRWPIPGQVWNPRITQMQPMLHGTRHTSLGVQNIFTLFCARTIYLRQVCSTS